MSTALRVLTKDNASYRLLKLSDATVPKRKIIALVSFLLVKLVSKQPKCVTYITLCTGRGGFSWQYGGPVTRFCIHEDRRITQISCKSDGALLSDLIPARHGPAHLRYTPTQVDCSVKHVLYSYIISAQQSPVPSLSMPSTTRMMNSLCPGHH